MAEIQGGLRHHLLNLIGAALVFVGLFVCGRGALLALGEIRELYDGATSDAMSTPDVSEEDRSDRIFSHAVGALWGLAPLTVGSTLLSISFALRKARRVKQQQAGVTWADEDIDLTSE